MKNILSKLYKWKWVVLGVVVVMGLGLGWKVTHTKKVELVTVKPERQTIRDVLEVTGFVDASEKIEIPYGIGKIAWVGVKEDQLVKKWQAVAKMDTQIAVKQMAQGMNTFNKQFRTTDNTQDTYDYYGTQGLSLENKRIIENSQFDLRNTALGVEIADITVKNATLVTPIEGIVTRVDKPFGGVNSGATDVIEVVNPKSVYFAAIVDETDVTKLTDGMVTTLVIDAFPGVEFKSSLTQIDFSPSTSRSGGVGYKIRLPLIDGENVAKLRLGMNGTAKIVVAEKADVITLPAEALISRDNKNYVDVLVAGKPVRKEVTIGLETDTLVEVVSGLEMGEVIVLPAKAQ